MQGQNNRGVKLWGYCEGLQCGVSLGECNFKGDEMFRKFSIWISASVVTTTLILAGTADANTLSKVSTRIVRNSNTGLDVCLIHNSNNVPVSAIVSVFPIGAAVIGIDNWTFPVSIGAFGGAELYSWASPRHAGSCKVLSVQ
jgi:hypothetical protein